MYNLNCRYDSRKSFYGKARIMIDDDGIKYLISYNTRVARIKDGKLGIYGFYSSTTLRHIKEFAHQELGIIGSKKELEVYLIWEEYTIMMD